MPVVEIEYHVPLTVQVDTDASTVLSAVVFDEETGDPVEVRYLHHDLPMSSADRAAALAVADDAEWPAWQVGY